MAWLAIIAILSALALAEIAAGAEPPARPEARGLRLESSGLTSQDSSLSGIAAGKRFTVPMLVGGKAVNGRAVVAADRTLTILFPSADGLSVDEIIYTLARQDGPGPEPKPDPKPPVPTPTKAIAVYLVYESQDPAATVPKFAAVKNDQGWRKAAETASMPQHVWDKDDPRFTKVQGVLATARARGLPSFVFVFADGTGKAEPVPETPAAAADLVKKYSGVKP